MEMQRSSIKGELEENYIYIVQERNNNKYGK